MHIELVPAMIQAVLSATSSTGESVVLFAAREQLNRCFKGIARHELTPAVLCRCSLHQSARNPRWHSLYVHVPSFEAIAQPFQQHFCLSLLKQVADLPELQLGTAAPAVQEAGSTRLDKPLQLLSVNESDSALPTAFATAGDLQQQDTEGKNPALVWTASAAAVAWLASQ